MLLNSCSAWLKNAYGLKIRMILNMPSSRHLGNVNEILQAQLADGSVKGEGYKRKVPESDNLSLNSSLNICKNHCFNERRKVMKRDVYCRYHQTLK